VRATEIAGSRGPPAAHHEAMGLFNSIKNKFLGISDADGHFFADAGTQRATTDEVARRVAALLQSPTLKLRDDGDEIHVTGAYRGRAARVVFGIDFGKVTTEIKLLAQDRTSFRLAHDNTSAEVYAASLQHRDQWDDDEPELKNYVARYVSYEGDRGRLAEQQRLWESFAPDLQAALIAMAETWKGSFALSSGTASIAPWEGVLGRSDAAQIVHGHLELAARAAEAIELRTSRLR
jgi:hypothetical protein